MIYILTGFISVSLLFWVFSSFEEDGKISTGNFDSMLIVIFGLPILAFVVNILMINFYYALIALKFMLGVFIGFAMLPIFTHDNLKDIDKLLKFN